MGSFSLWHWAILGITAFIIYLFVKLVLFIIKEMIDNKTEVNNKTEEKKLGFGIGFLCFFFPFIGIIMGIIKYKEPYGKNALLLGIAGLILSIIGALIKASNV